MYDLTRGKVSIKEWGNHLLQYSMVVSLMTPCLDYSCTTQYRDTPITVRVTFSLHQTDLLGKTHRLYRNYKDKFN